MHKKTVIFDVDGVLFEYDEWHGLEHYGKPIQENIDICNAFHQSDEYEVCIWTTRTNPYVQGYPQEQLIKALEDVLTQAGVKYHKILREPKPLFEFMIDDRTLNLDHGRASDIAKILQRIFWKAYHLVLIIYDGRIRNPRLP
jgi:FMN phosphatase YigB (HAD superfamily)